MSYTDVQDVADNLGRPITDAAEVTQVGSWIGRVESRIGRRITDLDERVTDPGYLDILKGVVVDVVTRRVHNPEGYKSERTDDYYYDRGSQSSDLSLTDDEWRELGWYASAEAFSTRPGFKPDRAPEPSHWS